MVQHAIVRKFAGNGNNSVSRCLQHRDKDESYPCVALMTKVGAPCLVIVSNWV